MKKNNPVDKAQSGKSVPNTSTPPPTSPLDEGFMEEKYGGYEASSSMGDVVRYSSKGRYATTPGDSNSNSLGNLENYLASPGDRGFAPESATLDKFAEARTGRYQSYLPGYDMEEAEALGQSSFDKAINGVTKGLGLMGTTFINSTVNLAYGAVQWGKTGEFSSFYDNDLTRSLDEFNKGLEDSMPNYYTKAERNANWYDPDYFFTSNFLWDGVVKNLGFAAGAALSGAAFTSALKALPLTARLFAAGKGAQVLSATEAGLASNTGKAANAYGKLLDLNKKFASGYNSMNAGGRAVVAGLATGGEASIEAMHNMHELKDTLVQEFIDENGYTPAASDMKRIEEAAAGAGNKAFLANVALLTATNYIQFPKILGSTYRGEKNIANGLVREAGDVVQEGGKYIAKKSKYPKLATLGRAVKNPYLFSYSEAFEEVSQFTAAVATKDYYKKKSQGEAASWVESFGVGIKDGMLSDEGAKNALIGGISGAIMMGPGKIGAARRKNKNTQNLISALNSSDLKTAFSKFTQETNDSVERAAVLQKERMNAIKDGRVLESKDLEADYIINYLTPRIKYGRLDLVKAEIAEYKKLASTKEGFNQLIAEGKALESDTAESFIQRLEKFEQTSNNINTLWQSMNLRYSALRDDKGAPLYDEDVINKMIYTSGKVADYDQRIPQITQELTAAGIDVVGLTQSLLEGNLEEFDKAYAQIENLNSVSKDELQEKLKDASEMILRRQEFFNTYEDIKANPSNFKEAKVSEDSPLATKQTIKIKTKRGERDIEIGTTYFAGKGVDYSKDPIDKKIQVSRFVVEGVTEDNKIKIKDLDTGKVSTVTADQFENFNVSKESLLKDNPTANFFFEHRNEMFEYNFGKNFGGKRRGRLEYKDGKLYFVYLDPKGKVTSKVVNSKDFEPQGDFKYAKVRQVGSVRDRKQGDARESFMTSKEIKDMDTGLKQTREDRLSLIAQLGEQAKEELKNITEKLAKQTEQLAKVKEDLKNIQKMKETGEKIKLNFSKATKSFTRSLNSLTKMQAEIEAEIESLEALKDENEFNIEYFESFSEEVSDSSEDNEQFIKELKDQQKLLKDNGVSLSSAIDKAKKLSDVTKKAIKSATKIFRNAIKSTYIVDQDYSEYLSDLLDQVASGENLQETWPLLKQEMANFALTSDLSKDTNINESLLLKALDDVNQLTEDLSAMRAEYKARKAIIDRFQLAINELNAKKAEEERLANNAKLVEQALKSGSTEPQTNFFASDKKFEPESKKPIDKLYKSTVPVDSAYSDNATTEPHQERANQFGYDLESFENRDSIRSVYVTAKTEALLGLQGLMDLLLNNVSDESGTETETKKFRDDQVILKEETFTVTDEDGGRVVTTVRTNLDGSLRKAETESFDADGNSLGKGRDISLADNNKVVEKGLTAEQLLTDRLVEGEVIEKTERSGTEINNPKRIAGLTTDQRQKLGLPVTSTRKQELKDKAIVMVMVNEGGELVGVDGQPIPQGEVLLDNVIFQAMPASGFRNGNMFRDGTTKEQVDAVNKQYNEWIESTLGQTAIGTPQNVEASFGVPQLVKDDKGNKVYTTTTSVEDAGLVTEVDITEGDPLIEIPTLGKVASQGTTTYSNVNGSVYLKLKNGLVKLKNRLHTEAEANAIYDVLLELSKVMVSQKGGITSDKAITLLNFLRGTVYWGIPETQEGVRKDPGNNSVFFEKDSKTGKFVLVMSNKGEKILFTPTDIAANKELMLSTLGGMYNNVSKSKAANTNEKFRQITSVSTEGEIKFKTWANYQTYLLSKKNPDGTEREEFELPLFTMMEPFDEADPNRKGIYFYTSNTADDFEIPEPAVQEAAAKSKPNYTVPKESKVVYKLDGNTTNTFTSPAGKRIFFKAKVSEDGLKLDDVQIIGNPGSDLAEVMSTMKNAGKTEDQIKIAIKSAVFNAIAPQAAKEASQGEWETSYTITDEDVAEDAVLDDEFELTDDEFEIADDESPIQQQGPLDPRLQFTAPGTSSDPAQQTSELGPLTEEEVIAVSTPRKIFKDRLDRINEFLQGKRKASATVDGNGSYTAVIYTDKFNEVDSLGRDMRDGVQVLLTQEEANRMLLIKAQKKSKKITLKEAEAAEQEVLRDVYTRALEQYEIVDDAPILDVKGRVEAFNKSKATTDPTQQTNEAEESNFEEVSEDDEFNSLLNDYAEDDGDETREVIDRVTEETENWSEIEKWMGKNFPMVPLYRVKNILEYEDGIKEAWGVFSKGAIYVYENAEVGTVYHEVFEGVWKTFTTAKEQENVLKEFKNRKGTFIDRPTGQSIKYSEATNQQAKEQLAEEFRDFILKKKAPKAGSLIGRIWKQLKSFIEKAILGKGFTEELFTRIDSGAFKSMKSPFGSQLSFANKGVIDIESKVVRKGDEARDKILNDKVTTDTIQEMSYQMLKSLVKNDKNIFELQPISEKEMYSDIYEKVMQTVKSQAVGYKNALDAPVVPEKFKDRIEVLIKDNLRLQKDITADWPRLTEKHKEYMRAFKVTFDEGSDQQNKDEDKIRESNKFDASKIDSFKAAPLGIKLLMATLPVLNQNGKRLKSSMNGRILLPVGKVYITLMNKLHTSKTVSEMMENLRKLAEEDSNYRTLYTRITKRDYTDTGVDYSKITDVDAVQILAGMWKTFKKQSPDVKNVFLFDNGEVVVGDATLSSAANQLRSEFTYSIAGLAKQNKGFFFYRGGAYYPNIKSLDTYTFDKSSSSENLKSMLSFLNRLGTPFTKDEYNKLSPANKSIFRNTVEGIKQSLKTSGKTVVISKKSLNISGNLLKLGILKEAASNPEFNSTYFNLSGERVQVFFGPNTASELYNVLSSVKDLKELSGTNYEYLMKDKDVFSQNSSLMKRMFRSDGKRKSTFELFKSGYVGGMVVADKGGKASSRLSKRDRFVQELNLNIVGDYLNLVPGDASLEWKLNMGNPISTNDLAAGNQEVNEIFKGYFISELLLSREGREIVHPKYKSGATEFEKRKTTDLRFFKGILGEELHNKIIAAEGDPIAVYEKFEGKINKKLEDYIDRDVSKTKNTLRRFGLAESRTVTPLAGEEETRYTVSGIDLPVSMTESQYGRELKSLSVNYMIANIEMHKVLYSDPYQYKDELKRTKSFLSPRQALISGDVEVNALLNRVYNKEFSAKKDKDGNILDIGFTDFMRDFMRTSTHKDVIASVKGLSGYEGYEETDGGGTIAYRSYRNFRIRANDWNREEEKQFLYDVEYENLVKKLDESVNSLKTAEAKDATRKRNIKTLDKFRAKDPKVQSAYKTLKPIVSGSKLGKDGLPSSFNNIVLDKYSLFPLSFKIMNEIKLSSDGNLGQNGINLYNKLQKEDIDYIVFDSGRKVGAETSHETYNKDGSFNNKEYVDVVNVPFSIMSLQTEVPSKEKALVTRGSQTTKLLTLDYMESGVPIDFKQLSGESEGSRFDQWQALTQEEKLEQSKVYKMVINNQELLNAMTDNGYDLMLDKLGLEDVGGKIVVTDFSEAANTLREEIFKREVNDNISDALTDFLESNADTVLEGTPVYQIVRNILYSVVDKNIVRPKISGSQKVQLSSAMFESVRPEFNKDLNGYTSDVLNFYEDKDGKRVMEVMVGRWFNSKMSDKELLEYLNETEEGQDILKGLAFRIPTQAQNSIDAIKIAGFLPKEFGDNVIVPSGIVAKVGSDFDIDKLSMYFKNIFYRNGKLESVPFFGIGQEAKDKFGEMFDNGEILSKKDRVRLEKELKLFRGGNYQYEDKLVEAIFGELGIVGEQDIIEEFTTQLSESDDNLRETIVKRLYKQSLENEYIRSSEKLVSDKLNFERLITPNDATMMKDLSNKVVEKISGEVISYSDVDNMLSREFMSSLRHDFVTGKKAIGIAAVSQTGLSNNQRTSIFINKDNIKNLSIKEQKYLGDGEIRFENYNTIERDGKTYATTSNIYNVKGGRISNVNSMIMDGFVDIAKGPWIMQMGITPKVAPVVLLLNSLGVPIEEIVYFINQPIIKQHLQDLENRGYSTPYIGNMIDKLKKDYLIDTAPTLDEDAELYLEEIKDDYPSTIPSEETLLENLGKGRDDLTQKERVDQVFILDEFLKYSMMADQSYATTQGSNYDTTRFNDPSLIFRKEVQTDMALNNVFSAFDNSGEVIPAVIGLLDSSFIGNLRNKIVNSRDAISNFLISDRGETRNVLEELLTPYAKDRYFSDKDFVKLYRKAVNDLFDFAVQTDQKLNMDLQKSLLDKDGTASEVLDFINDVKSNVQHPSGLHYNDIVQSLEVRMSEKAGEGRPNNVTIKNKGGKAYDQNRVIHSFRELKIALQGKTDLYDKIVMLSILQSGLSPSPISFTDLLPYEDVSRIYNKTLPKLDQLSNLEDFNNLNMFQRNNYNDELIVPKDRLFRDVFKNFEGGKSLKYPSIDFLPASVKSMIRKEIIPQVMTKRASDDGADVISAIWNKNLGKKKIAQMRKEGDYSYVNKALMQKVYDESTGEPYVYLVKDKPYHIYKAINTFGDSFRAQEFYDNVQKSIFDNGYMKANEVSDGIITNIFDGEVKKQMKRPKYTKQAPVSPTQQTSAPVEQELEISVVGNDFIVGNARFPKSLATVEFLERRGYSPQLIKKIIDKIC